MAPGLYMFRQLEVNGPLNGTGVNIIIGSGGLDGSGNMNMTAGNGGGLSDMNGVLIFDQEVNGTSKHGHQIHRSVHVEFQRRDLFPLRII